MYQHCTANGGPRRFPRWWAQDHITGTLQRQVAEGRTAHAYLFTGTRGTGKTTCARILPRPSTACTRRTGPLQPVRGLPGHRQRLPAGRDGAGRRQQQPVDDIRELLSESVLHPHGAEKAGLYHRRGPHAVHPAFNALLKTIEEPPEHLMFILATTELHKCPPPFSPGASATLLNAFSPRTSPSG